MVGARSFLGLTAGVLLGLLVCLPARADTVTVFAPTPFAPVLKDLIPAFEARTSHHVTVVRDTAGGLASRIERGESFDLALLNATAIPGLTEKGKLVAEPATPVAKSGVGVAVKQGDPKPDISTVDAFKQALLATRAVAYTDPAAGGSSGIYVAKLFERLGIADAIKAKAVLVPGGLAAERLVNGQATIALQQSSELMVVPGAVFVGPLPPEIQNYSTYAAGIAQASAQPAAARAFLAALLGPAGAAALAHHGLEKP